MEKIYEQAENIDYQCGLYCYFCVFFTALSDAEDGLRKIYGG
jgi:hypothetical protein